MIFLIIQVPDTVAPEDFQGDVQVIRADQTLGVEGTVEGYSLIKDNLIDGKYQITGPVE